MNRATCALLLGGYLAVAFGGAASSAGSDLPASFAGTLPCADCAGIEMQLDLWPDGVFHLKRTYLGRGGHADDLGRWRRKPDSERILLYGGQEMPLLFERRGPDALVPLGPGGSAAPGTVRLERLERFAPAELELGMHGQFRYMADAARFEECLTGRSYPVAMEADYVALERAYLGAREAPGAPLMASFDGRIALRPPMEGPGPVLTVVVDRFIGVWPNQGCERATSNGR